MSDVPHLPHEHRICNLVPSKATEEDWEIVDALHSGALTAAPLPDSVDLREDWWEIGDQGETGSCVGWATADGVMRYLISTRTNPPADVRLSPRFLWMACKEIDQFVERPESFIEEAGTSLKAAADICRKYGMALESELPFVIDTAMVTGRGNTFYASAATRKASAYFNAQRDFLAWKRALAEGKPVLVGLMVDQEWSTAEDRGGMLDHFQQGTERGGHAVCLVGYRTDGRFIVRNSWGTGWGDQGFGYASPAYIQAAFFNESYILTL